MRTRLDLIAARLLAAKLLLVLLIGGALAALPPIFNHAQYVAIHVGNYGVPPARGPDLRTALSAWDAQHYLRIAVAGYSEAGPDLAFYPLWPYLVRAAMPLFGGDALIASLALANLLSLLGLVLLYDLLARRFSPALAGWGVALAVCYPGAFYFCLPYSEALFLALSVGVFWLLDRGRPGSAAALAFCLPLARPVGIFILVPLVVDALRQKAGARAALWALPPLLGYAGYFLSMWLETGNALVGFEVQRRFVAAPSALRLLDPLAFVASLLDVQALHSFRHSAIDRLAFVWFLAACVALARRRGRRADLLLYALPLGLVPAVTGMFMSFTRYLAVIFPVFAVTAQPFGAATGWRMKLVACGVLALCAALQVWLAIRHINYYWAG